MDEEVNIMKIGDKVKKLPSKERVEITYSDMYVITQNLSTGVYSLYQICDDGYVFVKTRKNDPLFKECGY